MNDTENDNIKELREAAEKAKKLPQMERELAFAKAGIDYESGHGEVLFKLHEGELTKDALLASATRMNLTDLITPVAGSEPVENASGQAERKALEQIQSAAQSNDTQAEGLGPDPWQTARDAMKESQQKGEPLAWQHAAALSKIVAADNRNDPRVKGKQVSEDIVLQAQSA